MNKISNLQFCASVSVFIWGSTILFGLGLEAKQDAYIVILAGMFIGILLCFLYIKINSLFPNKPFINICYKIFGKYLGWLIGFIYTTFALYTSIRNVRDLGELIINTLLPTHNLIIILLLIMILIGYAIYQELETIARVTTIIFPIIFFTLIIINSYLLSTNANFNNLLPILNEGLMPILKELYFRVIGFPYGEMVIFMIIIPQVNDSLINIRKGFIYSTILSSLTLTINTIMMITVLGATLAGQTSFPLIKSGELGPQGIINFDFFIAAISILTLLIKISLLMYAGVKGYSQLFRISYKKLCIFIPIIIFYLSIIIAKGYPQHIKFGHTYIRKTISTTGVLLPLATLNFYYIKTFLKKFKINNRL